MLKELETIKKDFGAIQGKLPDEYLRIVEALKNIHQDRLKSISTADDWASVCRIQGQIYIIEKLLNAILQTPL